MTDFKTFGKLPLVLKRLLAFPLTSS